MGTDEHVESCEDIRSEYHCKLCPKSFSFDKALYGHMRWHSTKGAKQELVSLREGRCLAPVFSDPSVPWQVTGKRGRKATYADSEMLQAAQNLLYLSSGGREEANVRPENDDGLKDLSSAAPDLQVEDINVADQQLPMIKIYIRVKRRHDAGDGRSATDGNQEFKTDTFELAEDLAQEQPTVKKIKLGRSDGVDPVDDNENHVCHTCNKSFPSHQALGGHTASHNKGKSVGVESPKRSKTMAGGADNKHECKVCGRVFLTGQSLGGHMRAHYEPQTEKNSAVKAEGIEQCRIGEENTGKISGESSLADVMEETNQFHGAEKDTEKVIFSESSSSPKGVDEINNKDNGESVEKIGDGSTLPAFVFDLNELPKWKEEGM